MKSIGVIDLKLEKEDFDTQLLAGHPSSQTANSSSMPLSFYPSIPSSHCPSDCKGRMKLTDSGYGTKYRERDCKGIRGVTQRAREA